MDAYWTSTTEISYFNFILVFNAVGVIYFAYTNQSQLLPIMQELQKPLKRRVSKVI